MIQQRCVGWTGKKICRRCVGWTGKKICRRCVGWTGKKICRRCVGWTGKKIGYRRAGARTNQLTRRCPPFLGGEAGREPSVWGGGGGGSLQFGAAGGQLLFLQRASPAAVVSDSRGTASGMATGSLVGVMGGKQMRRFCWNRTQEED
jgi:hypothetical protein